MDNGYHSALRQLAESYEAATIAHGGKSLSRVATIVVSSGSFFDRLAHGKTFTVANLERFAEWFRNPVNWPEWTVPADAQSALLAIGRPAFPTARLPQTVTQVSRDVAGDQYQVSKQASA